MHFNCLLPLPLPLALPFARCLWRWLDTPATRGSQSDCHKRLQQTSFAVVGCRCCCCCCWPAGAASQPKRRWPTWPWVGGAASACAFAFAFALNWAFDYFLSWLLFLSFGHSKCGFLMDFRVGKRTTNKYLLFAVHVILQVLHVFMYVALYIPLSLTYLNCCCWVMKPTKGLSGW